MHWKTILECKMKKEEMNNKFMVLVHPLQASCNLLNVSSQFTAIWLVAIKSCLQQAFREVSTHICFMLHLVPLITNIDDSKLSENLWENLQNSFVDLFTKCDA